MAEEQSTGKTEEQKATEREYQHKYRNTAKGRAASAWNHMKARVRGDYDTTCYDDVEIRMTREEFVAWAIPEFEKWIADHPDTTTKENRPSIDRIKSEGHYELGNIQIISHSSNCKKVRNVNANAPKGTKWCPACEDFVSHGLFYKSYVKSSGPFNLSIHCKSCDDERRRKRKALLRGQQCPS